MAASNELGSRVPRKAKNILDQLVGTRTMTAEGMEWLICATDPFHDDRVRCPGYPDLSTVNSVVQVYTTTVSLSAPTGATNPWDLHIPFIPISPPVVAGNPTPVVRQVLTTQQGFVNAYGDGVGLYSGFNAIVCGASGTDWLVSPESANLYNNGTISIPQKFTSGHSRLVAAGIELVNTTSQLYKGGSLTVYRAPSTVEEATVTTVRTVNTSPPTILAWSTAADAISLPPSTQSEAAIFTDSRTWSAEDGCYIVVPQTDTENPFRSLMPTDIYAVKPVDSSTAINNVVGAVSLKGYTTVIPPTASNPQNVGSNSHALPFECVGTILTGLNPNSTIQATVRYYFERIPATTEPDLLAMAQVPPAFDGVALEIYSRCLSKMPVGVPQNENPLGEWFTGILNSVASVAPKIGGFVSNLGNAISMVGGVQPSSSNATPQRLMNAQQRRQQQQDISKRPLPPPPPPLKIQNKNQKKKARKRKAQGA
jgi:hypothetical protein